MARLSAAALILTLLLPFGFACAQQEQAEDQVETSTIKAAVPPPIEDNEPMTTQTVEVGEDRSPNEGAFLSDSEPDGVPGGTIEPSPSPTATPR